MFQNYSIIVEANNANFNSHSYFAVYAAVDADVTINGILITLVKGVLLPIPIRSITSIAKIYLLGDNKDVYEGSTNVR